MKNKTKWYIRLVAAIISVTTIYLIAPWQAGLLYLAPLPETVDEQVEDAIAGGFDGIIVYSQKGGQDANVYASGWHNRSEKIPAYPDAFFKIASIGKLYNAAAVTKLVAQGSLSLDKTLDEYLPSLSARIEYADRITLAMLVKHRSGIPNYTDHKDFSWSESSIGSDASLQLVLDTPADFEPGTDYGYSNTNYLLLTRIMSNILGYDHHQFITNEILSPLALKHTFFSVDDINMSQLMSGYYVGYDDDFKFLKQGYVATAENVGIFLRALNDGSLFSEKEQQIYTSIYKYEHTGWVLGYYSIARYHKDIDTVVIQFVNTVGGNTITHADVIYSRIVKILRENNGDK